MDKQQFTNYRVQLHGFAAEIARQKKTNPNNFGLPQTTFQKVLTGPLIDEVNILRQRHDALWDELMPLLKTKLHCSQLVLQIIESYIMRVDIKNAK